MSNQNKRNGAEIERLKQIVEDGRDRPVMMLNLNYYSAEANFPDGELYNTYMAVLERLLPAVGAKILWRHTILGQVTGEQKVHEVLAVWYPSHQAFLDLPSAPGAAENYRLREIAVEGAVIHRISGEVHPFMPA